MCDPCLVGEEGGVGVKEQQAEQRRSHRETGSGKRKDVWDPGDQPQVPSRELRGGENF